jgi:hypothetical protein
MFRPPRVLFMTFSNDPGSDRIVAAMGRLGAQCAVVGSEGAFAARSRFAKTLFAMPRFGRYLPQAFVLGPRLNEIVDAWRPDVIVPLDELAARVLRDRRLYDAAGPGARSLIERSLGAPAAFEKICSRQQLIEAARSSGVRTPDQQPAADLAAAKRAAAALGYPIVLKREQTCGGAGVAIASDEASLTRAFRRARLKAAAKRLTSWMPGFQMSEEASLSLQRFISGSLAFRAVACVNGVVLEGVSFLAECRDATETTGSTILRQIEQPEMREATKTIVAALGCSGFVAFDFIVTPDEEAYLIEMNARPIACGHLGRLYGHDIYGAMFDNLCETQHRPTVPGNPPKTIALFPNELDRDPQSPLLDAQADVFHDVPWDDPGVVNAYVAWLEARHPAQRPHLRRRFQIERDRTALQPSELPTPGYPP